MKIYFKGHVPFKRTIKGIYNRALILTKNDVEDLAVGVCCVDKDTIYNLNRQHRKIDRPTDVLSFPFLNIDYKGEKLSAFDGEREPDGSLYLGDIYICKEIAKAQAKEYGHSFKRELCFLALHGLLHLLGYDHIEKQDEEVMMMTAESVLSACKIGSRT